MIKNKVNRRTFQIKTAYDDRGWTEIDWMSPDFENLIESSFTSDNRNIALKQLGINPSQPLNPQLSKLVGKWFWAKTFMESKDEYKVVPESIFPITVATETNQPLTLSQIMTTNPIVQSSTKVEQKKIHSKEDFAAWGRIGAAKRLDKTELRKTQDQLMKLISRERTLKNQCSSNLFEVTNLLKDIIAETLSGY